MLPSTLCQKKDMLEMKLWAGLLISLNRFKQRGLENVVWSTPEVP